MPRRIPTVFVGSSSEAIDKGFAELFVHALKQGDVSAPILWRGSPDFDSTRSTLENLYQAAKSYDYGFFIFTPDDHYQSRSQAGVMGRDNVLFEFGLFLGALGSKRVFGVVQQAETPSDSLKIPADLWGIQMERFKNAFGKELEASVTEATFRIRTNIKKFGPKELRLPVKKWGYDEQAAVFSITLDHRELKGFDSELGEGLLCIIVLRHNEKINPNEDPNIALSEARAVPRPLDLFNSDMVFEANLSGLSPEPGDILDMYLWLVPKDSHGEKITKMRDMLEAGGELLAHKAKGIARQEDD